MIHGRRSWLFPILLLGTLSGCRHKEPPPPPPVATAPPPVTPSSITVITPLPSLPQKAGSNVPLAPPDKPAPVPVSEPPKHPRKLKKKPAPAPTAPAADIAAGSPAQAPPTTPPAVPSPPSVAENTGQQSTTAAADAQQAAPALGELSTGTPIGSGDRNRILSEIQVQEARAGKLKEPSSGDTQALQMQMQIRSFLTKARQAAAENDLDGAQTLSTKARVLLDELQNE